MRPLIWLCLAQISLISYHDSETLERWSKDSTLSDILAHIVIFVRKSNWSNLHKSTQNNFNHYRRKNVEVRCVKLRPDSTFSLMLKPPVIPFLITWSNHRRSQLEKQYTCYKWVWGNDNTRQISGKDPLPTNESHLSQLVQLQCTKIGINIHVI